MYIYELFLVRCFEFLLSRRAGYTFLNNFSPNNIMWFPGRSIHKNFVQRKAQVHYVFLLLLVVVFPSQYANVPIAFPSEQTAQLISL